MIDFANSYAESGNPHYQKFLRYLEDYAPIKMTILLHYMTATRNNQKLNKTFNQGEFKFPTDPQQVDERLGILSSFQDICSWWYTEAFSMAIYTALQIEGYDNERMLKGYQAVAPTRPATRADALRDLERAYNYNIKADANIVRIF